jgi:radical SAM superfamily enzyme YgiQ (UPF0313 family)
MEKHSKGTRARVLLSSVFGPYAQDDEFGSRAINPMELYHNQVTRGQGEFSLRMFHRSWGLMMIQHNISAPCTLLDFPTRERFEREVREGNYDVVGISSIIVNVRKVAEMCRIVRQVSPGTQIVIGGHVSAIPDVEQIIAADHIVKGEGIRWMREYLGDDVDAPIHHPQIMSGFGLRTMGLRVPEDRATTAATVISSVGCPMGCNFCATSAFFGGKGKFINFYETGDQLFDVMCDMERSMGVRSFFISDENFLLYRPRALRLLERMKKADKSWAIYCFSSVNAIRKYTMQELVELGISWIWLGLESPRSGYEKLNHVDTRALAAELRSHGIKLLGSTIVGMEHHTPDNIAEEIEYAVAHGTDFHQFMLYTPVPGTPLYRQMQEENRLIDVDVADIHGQHKFNFKHPAISRDESKRLLDWAFTYDFERNGPSVFRICQTLLQGWRRYKNSADERVRRRFECEARTLRGPYNAALWAMEKRLWRTNAELSASIRKLRLEIEAEFGWSARSVRMALGPVLLWTSKREAGRLAAGTTYEPPTVVERRNWTTAPDSVTVRDHGVPAAALHPGPQALPIYQRVSGD